MLEKLSPVMPSKNIDLTEAFYHKIGFETVYKTKDPGYLLLKRQAAELHFFHQPAHDPATSQHGAYLRPSDIDAFSDELLALGLPSDTGFPRFQPVEDKAWGMREATLWDLDGHLLRAGQET